MIPNDVGITRRGFSTLALATNRGPAKEEIGSFHGYFAILQTPFSSDDRIDLTDLHREVQFVIRCRCEGMVWPHLLSEFYGVKTEGRLQAAEAILRTAPGAYKLTVGVQAPDKADGVTGAMGPSGLADVASRLYPLYREGKTEQARSLYSLLSSVMVFESLFGGVGPARKSWCGAASSSRRDKVRPSEHGASVGCRQSRTRCLVEALGAYLAN